MDKPKMGRPPIEIDKVEFEKLCGLHATLVEIADWFDCSEDTIENWCKKTYGVTFSEILKRKSSKAKVSLRRKQYETAMKGNVVLMIWLGKQHLGQRDYKHVELDTTLKNGELTQEEKTELARKELDEIKAMLKDEVK